MSWSLTIPLSSSGVSASVSAGGEVRSNWEAIESWQSIEHYEFDEALSGTHKASTVSVVGVNTSSASSAESGALWLDSSCGEISIFSSGGWYSISKQQFKVRASLTTNLLLPSTTSTQLTFASDFDLLSACSASTITIPQSGYYLVRSSVMLSSTSRNHSKKLEVKVNGTEVASTKKYGYHSPYLSIADILKLNASDEVTVYLTNSDTQIQSAGERDLEVFRI